MSVSRFKKFAAIALFAGASLIGFAGSAHAEQSCRWVGGGPYDRSGYRCVEVRRGPDWNNHRWDNRGWDDHRYYPPVVYRRPGPPPPPVVYYQPAPRVVYTQPYYVEPRSTTIFYYSR